MSTYFFFIATAKTGVMRPGVILPGVTYPGVPGVLIPAGYMDTGVILPPGEAAAGFTKMVLGPNLLATLRGFCEPRGVRGGVWE